MAIHSYTYIHSDKEKLPAVLAKVAKFIRDNPGNEVIEITYRCNDRGLVMYYLKSEEKR